MLEDKNTLFVFISKTKDYLKIMKIHVGWNFSEKLIGWLEKKLSKNWSVDTIIRNTSTVEHGREIKKFKLLLQHVCEEKQ